MDGGYTGLAANGDQTMRAPKRDQLLQESEAKVVLPDSTMKFPPQDESYTVQRDGPNFDVTAPVIPNERNALSMI